MKLPKQLLIAGLALVLSAWLTTGFAQTCTALTSGNWNSGPPGGRATWDCGNPDSFSGTIIIPEGITVTLNNNKTWNANVEVYGTLILDSQLNLGSASGCGYTLRIFGSGILNRPAGPDASDRLIICGKTIITSQPGPPAGTLPWIPEGYDSSVPGGGFGENGVLPIVLIDFSTQTGKDHIVVNWATSKEDKFDYFSIEHSNNGIEFFEVGLRAGAGYNTDSRQDYSFKHVNPYSGTNYYRLKAVDLDGSYEYFGPIAQVFTGSRRVKIYPNPTSGEFIQVDLNFNPSERARLAIINTQGVEVMNLMGVGSTNRIELNSLSPGMYTLKFISPELTETQRFIVR